MNIDRQVIKLYERGHSSGEIANRLGFKSHVSILNRLRKAGVKRRNRSEFMQGKRNALKHSCTEHFFDTIRTQGQAYLLGLLVADGWISRSSGYRVAFSSIDRCQTLLVKRLLKASNPLGLRKNGGWEITISSEILVDGLARYGCIERKSLTALWPDLPEKLYPHFVRGLFDGDGGIRIDKKGNARFSVCGSLSVVTRLAGLFRTRPLPHGAIWKVDVSGNHRVFEIGRYLYRYARFYLSRKKKVFDAIRRRNKKVCPR